MRTKLDPRSPSRLDTGANTLTLCHPCYEARHRQGETCSRLAFRPRVALICCDCRVIYSDDRRKKAA